MGYRYETDKELIARGVQVDGRSYASSSTSDSVIATEYNLKNYAKKVADRMYENNIEEIDKDFVAGMIYSILTKNAEQRTLAQLVDDMPSNEENLFTNKEFEV